MTPGIIKKLYHTTPVGLTDEDKQEVYPITATSAVYSAPGESSFPNMSLDNILDALNEGCLYLGKALPSTNPGTYNHKVFYVASEPGTYSYFDNIEVTGLTILKNTGNGWTKDEFNITSGSGGGGGGYIGYTPTQEEPLPQALSGITQINLLAGARIYFSENAYIELDQYGFHFSRGLYSDYFVSAGGIGSGGGGGGGGSYAAGNGITIANDTISVKIGNGLSFDASGALTANGIGSESDPVFVASPAHGITSSDITNWRATKYTLGTTVGTTASRGTLYGATGISAYLSGTSNDDSLIVWDSQHGAWHFTGNLYADGWVSAGGVGSGSGNATSLYSLAEVLSTTNPTTNQIFYFNGTKWTSISLKTINNQSLLGSGNISISGGGGAYALGTPTTNSATRGTLYGATGISAYASGSSNTDSLITWEENDAAWHFHGNLYADGWVAAGGIGSSSSGGGTDLDRVWESLTNNTDKPNVKINVAHIPDLSGTYLTNQNIHALTLNAGPFTAGTYTPNSAAKSFNIPTTLDHISDGTNRKLSDYVTLSTPQTIDGAKTFTAPVTIDPIGDASSYIDIGNARLVYDAGANALHITKKSGASGTIGIFADGFVAAGGVAGQTTLSYVDLESNQTVGGNKTFTGTTQLGQTTIGTISILGSGTAPYINNTLDRIYIQRAGQTGVSMCATAGQVVIGALNTSNSSKLYVNGNAAFAYATGKTVSISEIVNRIEALENA